MSLWPGWSFSHVSTARVKEYLKLYVPAALSIASDFWRLALVGAVAASFGPTDVSTFTASYRIMWLSLVFCGSIAGGVSILLTIAFGSGKHRDAKKIALIGCSLIMMLCAALGVLVFFTARDLGSIFTNDAAILREFDHIRLPFALTVFMMNFAVALERIPMAMGRPKLVLVVGLIGSWVFQVPLSFLLVKVWKPTRLPASSPLFRLYAAVAAGYAAVTVIFAVVIATTDWKRYADEARQRSELEREKMEKLKAERKGEDVADMTGIN